MYPEIPIGFALAREHLTSPGGTGHAYIIHGIVATEADFTVPDVVASAVGTAFDQLMPQLGDGWTHADTSVVWNPNGTLSEGLYTSGVAGTGVGPWAGVQCAVIVRKETGLIGRHFRGRCYLPGLPAGALTSSGDSLTPTALSNWQAAVSAWKDKLIANLVGPVVLHKDVAVPPTPVGSFTVLTEIGTQRRRLRKAAHR